MSYTTIYKMGDNSSTIADISNGHRGAMYVWNQIAKKYFDQDRFPMFDEKLASKIWNAHKHAPLTDAETIVLMSTMDKSTVNNDGLSKLIAAFEVYGGEHDISSFSEQAEKLKNTKLSDNEFIGWQQTSCGEFWGETGWDEETEEAIYYDPNVGDIHFDIIQEFNEFKSEQL